MRRTQGARRRAERGPSLAHRGWPAAGLLLLLAARSAGAASGIVPDDFPSVQAALDQARPGDVLQVRETPGPWFERVRFVGGGDAVDGFVSLEAFPGDSPVLDATGLPAGDVVLIEDLSWVRIRGFEIRNALGVSDGSGIRVLGSGSSIEIVDNTIHDIRGDHAMGITVYATDPAVPISALLIDGNLIHDCEPARSEALTLNGNVDGFVVSRNVVRDVNNIGIDFIGGEIDICPDPTKVARNGTCRFNRVERANSIYGGGWAAGIYVDGGRDIVIENNVVTGCDLGIEIGAENAGVDATGIVVRSNVVFDNDKVGIVFGGYDASVGRVRNCRFLNNTLYRNDTLGEGLGELWIQFAEDNLVASNVLVSTEQNLILYSEEGNVGNTLRDDLWFAPGGADAAEITWRGDWYAGLAAFQAATGQGLGSAFADPMLVDPGAGDFHLAAGSPAIDFGDPGFVPEAGEVDLDGEARLSGGRVDAGADEVPAGCAAVPGPATGLRLRKASAADLSFQWDPDAEAGGHRAWAVESLDDLPARGDNPAAWLACEAEGGAVVSCLQAEGLAAGAAPLVLYQLVATCAGDPDVEGPS